MSIQPVNYWEEAERGASNLPGIKAICEIVPTTSSLEGLQRVSFGELLRETSELFGISGGS